MRIFVQKQPFSVWNSHFSVMRISWFRHAAEILNLNLEEDVLPSWYPGKDIINRNAQLKSLNTEDGTSDYLISFPDLVNYANQRFFIIFNFQSIIFSKKYQFEKNFNQNRFDSDKNTNFDWKIFEWNFQKFKFWCPFRLSNVTMPPMCNKLWLHYKIGDHLRRYSGSFSTTRKFQSSLLDPIVIELVTELVTEFLLVTILKPYSKMNNGQNHYRLNRLTTVHFCHQHRLCLSTSVTRNPSPKWFSLW